MRYAIPAARVAAPHTATVEVHKSRFIGWCAHAPDIDTARALVAAARAQYPDASHHCSAYIAGAPDEQQAIGFADDGEPGGTAGRPMFQALAGSGLGQIACVVTRYFGGTKLGTGGLARAYAQCVSALLTDLPVAAYVPRQPMVLEMGFADEQAARAWLGAHDGQVVAADYHAAGARLTIAWPCDASVRLAELDARLDGRLSYDTATAPG
ncbi:IMPACT family protein [Salinisphaera japonica]|uniref:IMPACT family member n=1 Tax=Salinisphaera japonica YTM-1 TaxID=1209778 RepID=A0A423PZF3_9GAMM|nr:YigZ family protein [Salinisphaera japonica]ROO30974.1 IMPACT family member [Salinisphaera japonica YTM-1]